MSVSITTGVREGYYVAEDVYAGNYTPGPDAGVWYRRGNFYPVAHAEGITAVGTEVTVDLDSVASESS